MPPDSTIPGKLLTKDGYIYDSKQGTFQSATMTDRMIRHCTSTRAELETVMHSYTSYHMWNVADEWWAATEDLSPDQQSLRRNSTDPAFEQLRQSVLKAFEDHLPRNPLVQQLYTQV